MGEMFRDRVREMYRRIVREVMWREGETVM